MNVPGVYQNTDLETPTFNRDPAFTGHSASIKTLTSSIMCLLMSFVPMFPVYVNFTLRANSERLQSLG